MKPWLAVYGVSIAFSVLGIFALFCDHLAFTVHHATPEFNVACIVVLALYIYCFMAVHSLYENMREKSQSELVILTVGSLKTSNNIPQETQSQMDFTYVRLV